MRLRKLIHAQIREVAQLPAQPVDEDNGRPIPVFDVMNTVRANVDEPALRRQRFFDTMCNVQGKNRKPRSDDDANGDDGQEDKRHVLTFTFMRALALRA